MPTLLPPPIIKPCRGSLPVLLSVPHSGREYPAWLTGMARGGRAPLRVLEDPFVDRLVWRAVQHGIGAVIAQAPRAAVDCNRAEDDIDPSVVQGMAPRRISARARGGLGIVPGRTAAHGNLWRHPIGHAELEQRLAQAHRPFHDAVAGELERLVDRFGCALLLDCHSMPPPAPGVPPVVFGNHHGRTAAGWLTMEAVQIAAGLGFTAQLNDPFAGGHVIERHARPEFGVHAIQVEIDRRYYLDGRLAEPGPGFDGIARLMESLALGLGDALLARRFAVAAE